MFRLRFLVLGTLMALLVADTASAGLFGLGRRRWEHRKAQLRAELVWQLEHKMDQDMAREVESITAQLTATAESQVKLEAEKLEHQVQQALTQLREEAASLVAEEAKRLDQAIDSQLADLEKRTADRVQAEAQKLQQQADQQLTALTARFQEQSKALQSTLDQQLAKIPGQITEQIDKAMPRAAKPAEVSEGGDEPAPAKKPAGQDEVSLLPGSALPSKEVEVVVESEGGSPEDDQDS
jgi:hypothetical protein